VARYNPWRDPAADIELGQRVRVELMSTEDWDEILRIWLAQDDMIPVET
jgi:hypothetical protein